MCPECKREIDLSYALGPRIDMPGGQVIGQTPYRQYKGPVLTTKHLPWIEYYTNTGAYPKGFCLGSEKEPAQVTPERAKRSR